MWKTKRRVGNFLFVESVFSTRETKIRDTEWRYQLLILIKSLFALATMLTFLTVFFSNLNFSRWQSVPFLFIFFCHCFFVSLQATNSQRNSIVLTWNLRTFHRLSYHLLSWAVLAFSRSWETQYSEKSVVNNLIYFVIKWLKICH